MAGKHNIVKIPVEGQYRPSVILPLHQHFKICYLAVQQIDALNFKNGGEDVPQALERNFGSTQ